MSDVIPEDWPFDPAVWDLWTSYPMPVRPVLNRGFVERNRTRYPKSGQADSVCCPGDHAETGASGQSVRRG